MVRRDPAATLRARELRAKSSEAEKRLWYRLQNRQVSGHKFRRQHAIGPYIGDFVCLRARLVIELDGGQHSEPANEVPDARRTAWLEGHGYRVLRFWNTRVLTNTDDVVAEIFNELNPSHDGTYAPHPNPLPEGEREI